ncbi:MAG: hypothetical protein AABZ15_11350 [Nitrospirota bacterium]
MYQDGVLDEWEGTMCPASFELTAIQGKIHGSNSGSYAPAPWPKMQKGRRVHLSGLCSFATNLLLRTSHTCYAASRRNDNSSERTRARTIYAPVHLNSA